MKATVTSTLVAILLSGLAHAEPFPQLDPNVTASQPSQGADAVVNAIDRWAFSTIQINSFVDIFAENATSAVEDKNILSAQGFARTDAAQFNVIKGMSGLSLDAQDAINKIAFVIPKIVEALDRIPSEGADQQKADVNLINVGRCCTQLPAMETLFRSAVKVAKLDLGDGVTTVVEVPASCAATAASCQEANDGQNDPSATQQGGQESNQNQQTDPETDPQQDPEGDQQGVSSSSSSSSTLGFQLSTAILTLPSAQPSQQDSR
ncbi:hypothetical protein K491DRAFT_694567 [Lophiostoma macrostomum CBS 122681]|uniref:Cell wall protein n=1 Tax=Lophiostoma macrostomum CBS 122681 TaxID=1314788 RepID=A0A6A6T0R3_9PLEO|nr:hypothetical protein K491DRAFT_694567 [Lophiostoma macrostomum CBS 122681]